jgi:FlaA1/EpsC-like NDP-sugar epimerase
MTSAPALADRMLDFIDTVTDQVVLVTGGTGSFGQAFVDVLLAHGRPRKVIVFSRDEQKHYQLERTPARSPAALLRRRHPRPAIACTPRCAGSTSWSTPPR